MTTNQTPEVDQDTWEQFIERVEHITNVRKSEYLLYWDQEVMMPEDGRPARSKQISALSSVLHELYADEELGELLDELENSDLDGGQEAIVEKLREEHDREASVPRELVQELSEAKSDAHQKWKEAKAEDDYSIFAPAFERVVEVQREMARHIDPDSDPYAVLFGEFDPHLDFETVEDTLVKLRDELVSLIEAIHDSDVDLTGEAFEGSYDSEAQEELSRDALDMLGFDWDRGRLDATPFQFTSGLTQFDIRIGIPFEDSGLLESVLSTVHEFGHGIYIQNLPDEHYGTPLGNSREVVMHIASARFWRDHIGRTEAFWEQFLPTVHERFPETEDVTPQEAHEAANKVYDDNPIRLEADELTDHLHIIIRYEIERDLIRGNLDVEDVPEVWNDKYEEYLGVRPETDAEGCLQDIHWANGSYAYFPAYTMGSVVAAQLYAGAEDDLGEPLEHVRDGDFEVIDEWLCENVHRHGKRYPSPEMIERATGEPLTADYYLDYVTDKYGDLYDLDDY